MSPIAKLLMIPLVAAVAGIIAAFFVGRAPMSGRAAIALLCFPVLSILLLGLEFGSDIVREFVAGALFGFSVPVCFAYSLHARRRASDRRATLAGFAGSILFGLAYLLMPQLAFHFVRELTSAGGSH